MRSISTRDACNATRYPINRHGPQKVLDRGHYESWFLRANHPEKPLAFWIRYTIFSPQNRPIDAVGELWGVFFDGERNEHTAVRERHPLKSCTFHRDHLDVQVASSTLGGDRLVGQAASGSDVLSWSLAYTSPEPPLLLLSNRLYEGPFPKAKALVASPQAEFKGSLEVNKRRIDIDRWVGSQNHNWGSKHTDSYAWGQVAGFDQRPDAFLECGTGRVKLGPLWTPWMTLIVLRLGSETYRWNSIWDALRARGTYEIDGPTLSWKVSSQNQGGALTARFSAPTAAFVALPYDNPPGGIKTCLNSKIAQCELTLTRPGEKPLTLTTTHRAAFEVLTDLTVPSIQLRDI